MYHYHHHYNLRSVLKKNYNTEYDALIKQYGEENIELIKELAFAFKYRCWINDDGWNKEMMPLFIESEDTYTLIPRKD